MPTTPSATVRCTRSGTDAPALTAETPTALSWFNSQNRITSWGYDASGNILSVAAMSRTFAYDAENRQVAFCTAAGDTTCPNSPGSGRTLYSYDGDGRRVKKSSASGTTVYVYDPQGRLAQEYAPSNSNTGTEYLSADHLGSTRLVMSSSGNTCHDYMPFGEELPPACTPSNDTTLKFTSKERDSETGLDYFGARYMSSAQGRFTSTDPKQFSMRTLGNPQKWNKYAYTLNNPLALVDPDGKEEIKVTVRAFIPDSSFTYPAGIGPTWKGDGRSFTTAPNASSRAQATFTIETDPTKSAQPLVGKPTFSTSGSAVDVYGLLHCDRQFKRDRERGDEYTDVRWDIGGFIVHERF